jgi:hypothetical protein
MVCRKVFGDAPLTTTVKTQRATLRDGTTPQTEEATIEAFEELTEHLKSIETSPDRKRYAPLASKALWCGNINLWNAFRSREFSQAKTNATPDRRQGRYV